LMKNLICNGLNISPNYKKKDINIPLRYFSCSDICGSDGRLVPMLFTIHRADLILDY